MKKLIFIFLLMVPMACFSQSEFKKGIKVGTDIWVIDSVFIRNDSLIFRVNDTIEYGAVNLDAYLFDAFTFPITSEAWIEHRRRYHSN
jgi:hypothetical protein